MLFSRRKRVPVFNIQPRESRENASPRSKSTLHTDDEMKSEMKLDAPNDKCRGFSPVSNGARASRRKGGMHLVHGALLLLTLRTATAAANTEAYATLVYGDTSLACSAFVLGTVLRTVDPARPRIALIHQVSERVRSILSAAWTLHEGSPATTSSRQLRPRRHQRGWRTKAARKARQARKAGTTDTKSATRKNERLLRKATRKNELWRLPFSRVMYFDADAMVLPSTIGHDRGERLRALWRQSEAAELSATPARLGAQDIKDLDDCQAAFLRTNKLANTCFNTGLMVLRPSAATFARLDEIDPIRALEQPEPYTGRSCPGFDQRFLNRAFPNWSRLLPWRNIPHWEVSPTWANQTGVDPSSNPCLIREREVLLSKADSYHHFHSYGGFRMPWDNEFCAACVRAGLPCRPKGPKGHTCALHAVTFRIFWETFLQHADAKVAAECLNLTKQQPIKIGKPSHINISVPRKTTKSGYNCAKTLAHRVGHSMNTRAHVSPRERRLSEQRAGPKYVLAPACEA